MLILAIWLGLSVVVAIGASVAGRRGVAWFIISVLISPLLSALALILFSEREGCEQSELPEGESAPEGVAAQDLRNSSRNVRFSAQRFSSQQDL